MEKIMMRMITKQANFYFLLFTFTFLLFSLNGFAQTCSPAPIGLVSWWQAENNSVDSSSRNNGTLLNGATFAAGNIGQAFNFDGVNDSVQVPDNANQNINGSFSAETWIFPRSVSNNSPRILEKSDGSNRWVLLINQSSPANALGIVINPSQVALFSPPNSIVLNQWSHVAFTYDSVTNEVKLFINGTQVATTTTTAITTTTTNPLVIGNDFSTGTRPFDGLIDEPAIYNSALSATQIQAIFNSGTAGKCKPTATVSPSGLVGWWAGDGNANDIAGTNNGAFVGNFGIPDFAVGKVGQNFKFQSNLNTVQVPDNSTLDFTNAFTIEMWVAPTEVGSPSGTTFFISKGNFSFANTQSYGIIFGDTGRIVNRVGNGSTLATLVSNASLPLNTFSHIATTYDGSTLRVYINGVLDNSKATSIGTLLNTAQPLFIGGADLNGTTIFARSAIDETSLYNRALSGSEIASIFNAGIAGKLKQNTTPTGSNVVVNAKSDATVTFPTVSTAGITQQIPLDLSLLPSLPLGSTTTGLTYDIATTAIFTGSPQVCFNLPSITNSTTFNNLRILHLESNLWQNRTDLASINFATKTVCTSGLTSLSPFAVVNGFAPTAANASITGRILTANGQGIRNVIIQLTSGTGETKHAYSSSFGYYRFEDLAVGQTYVLTVLAKKYSFTNPTRLIGLNEDLTDEDFVSDGN
jgi:hypothetical protein